MYKIENTDRFVCCTYQNNLGYSYNRTFSKAEMISWVAEILQHNQYNDFHTILKNPYYIPYIKDFYTSGNYYETVKDERHKVAYYRLTKESKQYLYTHTLLSKIKRYKELKLTYMPEYIALVNKCKSIRIKSRQPKERPLRYEPNKKARYTFANLDYEPVYVVYDVHYYDQITKPYYIRNVNTDKFVDPNIYIMDIIKFIRDTHKWYCKEVEEYINSNFDSEVKDLNNKRALRRDKNSNYCYYDELSQGDTLYLYRGCGPCYFKFRQGAVPGIRRYKYHRSGQKRHLQLHKFLADPEYGSYIRKPPTDESGYRFSRYRYKKSWKKNKFKHQWEHNLR